ncbi:MULTISPECIES: TadE/TadG family type IV pilus assembly protein [unclassified Gilliamella]|uniref:TadE/TadG family type IV pilus assembly protein n=1 Tax=unclassified Gilliamella TaxID=2685620 RepID=UPI00080E154D|nr:TadE/TadG family type IV pilus assembly protein [Gilliamella apicola]OCG22546.1 hypothetical protein A9G23_02615 [Gilliamella apicola]OCG23699.1 hypothetical protein A9G22_05620 [Gilliamella apicola]
MNNNNKLKRKNYKKSFLQCTAGNIIISFAIMFPAMFICMYFSIDQTQNMRTRARISEATNEASLAVVAINNKIRDQKALEKNIKIALNYINYFMNQTREDLIGLSRATITYDKDKKEYYVRYVQEFASLLDSDGGFVALNQNTVITNNEETYGNTRKYYTPDSVGIAFISDFSGSATCQYSDSSCNNYSQGLNNDRKRLDYMKKAIVDIIDNYKKEPQFNFALVPYDIGVPVPFDPNEVNNKEKSQNPAGGGSYACSLMYKMKSPFDSVDYNFWANKNIAYPKWNKLKKNDLISNYVTYDYFADFKNTVYYYLDYYNYLYYSKIIGPAKGLNDNESLVDGGLCRKRHNIERVNMGSTRYACGENNTDYPLNQENKNTIESQYGKVVQLYDYMFSNDYPDVHYSFANTKTVDVKGTIDTLFSGMNVNTITFNRPISPAITDFSPFQGMCQSPLYSNEIMSEKVINMPNSKRLEEASKHISKFKLSPHLIPFSDDSEHNIKLLNSIKSADWQPGGGTDTMTALLRTVPVMARGNTINNKVMIIITDGKDDAGADVLRDEFLDNNVCQSIREGLKSEQNQENGYIDQAAKNAAIYYIKLDPNAGYLKTDSEYERAFGKWFTKCMNGHKQFLHEASDYKTLYDAINRIIEVETGNFVIKKEQIKQ